MTWIFIKKIFLFDDTQHGMLRLIIVSLILRTNLSNKFDKIVCFILCLIYLWTNLNRTLIKFLRLMKLWNYEQNRMVANVHKIMLKFKFIIRMENEVLQMKSNKIKRTICLVCFSCSIKHERIDCWNLRLITITLLLFM